MQEVNVMNFPTANVQHVIAVLRTDDGTDGGALTADVWNKYPLSDFLQNDDAIASLVANEIVLPPGDFQICSGAGLVQGYQWGCGRLINVTTGAILSQGIPFRNDAADFIDSQNELITPQKFTLAVSTPVRFEVRVNTLQFAVGTAALGNGGTSAILGQTYNLFGFIWLAKIN